QKMVLLENVNGHHFEDVTEQVGPALLTPQHGRGLAWTDWNRDGKVDLLVTPTHAPAQLLENRSNVNGSSLTLQLIGTKSPRQPIGTTVTLITSSGTQTKQLIGGGSYASTSLPEIHFGVPRGSTPTEVRIKWPSGTSQLISLANADDRLVVIEQRAVAVRPPH
ncbi:MAG: CRTAC1 family protein, partial [Fuerstiella sp.]|nr:CRTAC1 family protein [Fuerstiella sp.]